MDRTHLTRRAILAGGLAAATGFRSRDSSGQAALDLTTPEDNLTALVKLRGDLSGKTVLFWYEGKVTGFIPGEASKPLYSIQGLIRSTWTRQDDGSFAYLAHDLGFVGDLSSGEPVETMTNPYTGDMVRPIDTRDGPLRGLYTVHGVLRPGQDVDQSKRLILPWTVNGNDLWIETDLGFSLPNPLQPDKWPKASSGEMIQIRFQNTYKGRMSELTDPKIASAPATAIYAGHTSWPPWLLMGQTPGFINSKAIGRKLRSADEIPLVMQSYIRTKVPDFLTNSMPWAENANAWQHYQHEREPHKS